MADPVWARDHVLTVLQRFEREGTNPTFPELQEAAAMGRDDLSTTLTVLDEEGSIRQLDGGHIQLVDRSPEPEGEGEGEPESVAREEEALAELEQPPVPFEHDAEDGGVVSENANFRVDWATGSCWSRADSADAAAAEALGQAERQGTDTADMTVYVVPAEHVQVFAIERTPRRVK